MTGSIVITRSDKHYSVTYDVEHNDRKAVNLNYGELLALVAAITIPYENESANQSALPLRWLRPVLEREVTAGEQP